MIKLPDELTPKAASRAYGGQVEGYRDGWNACLAEVQRLNATAQPVSDDNNRIADALESLLWPNMAIGNKAVILSAINALRTAPAQPVSDGRAMREHEFSQLVNELRDVPAIQSKREKIVGILKAFNIRPAAPGGQDD